MSVGEGVKLGIGVSVGVKVGAGVSVGAGVKVGVIWMVGFRETAIAAQSPFPDKSLSLPNVIFPGIDVLSNQADSLVVEPLDPAELFRLTAVSPGAGGLESVCLRCQAKATGNELAVKVLISILRSLLSVSGPGWVVKFSITPEPSIPEVSTLENLTAMATAGVELPGSETVIWPADGFDLWALNKEMPPIP